MYRNHQGIGTFARLGTAGFLCLAVTLFGFGAVAADFETPLAIQGATLVPAPGRVIENAVVLIENGRISAAGARVKVPAHADTLDASGLWLYAGFIDGASHVGIGPAGPPPGALARLRDEEQDVRQGPRTAMQLANRNGVWPQLSVRDLHVPDGGKEKAYRAKGFTAALVVPHPAIFGGTGDVLQLSGAPLRRAVVAKDVVQIGSYRKGSGAGSGYPVSRMGSVALMRQMYLDAAWYRDSIRLAREHPGRAVRPLHDPVLDAMRKIVNGEQRMLFVANTASEIHHALDLADEFNQQLIILGGKQAWKVAERLATEKASVIVSLDWPKKPQLAAKAATKQKKPDKDEEEEAGEAGEDTAHEKKAEPKTPPANKSARTWTPKWEDDFFEPLAVRQERIRLWEEQVNNTARLIEAGVPVAFTSRDLKGPDDLWKKAQEAVKAGLTAEQLLACLTTGPASILGVDAALGTVASGKIANLTLMSAPLTDKKARVRGVVIEGELFELGGRLLGEDQQGPDDSEEEDDEKPEAEGEGEDTKEADEKQGPEDKHPWIAETEADRIPKFKTGGTVLLRGAKVLTITNGVLEGADVLVQRGRITRVGNDLSAPRGAKVIDLTGYWLMPGIVDPHSHMALWDTNESSQSVTAEVRMADVVEHEQLSIHRALAGGVTTIHTMHGSANTIGGQDVVLKLKYRTSPAEMIVTSGPRIVKFALGENVTRVNSSQRGQRFPGTRMGVESVLRQSFNDALEYGRDWDQYGASRTRGRAVKVPRRDLRLEALGEILDGDIWIHSHGYRGDELLRLLAVTEDYGVRVACLQHVLEGYRILPEMRRHGVAGSTFADYWSYKVEAKDAIPHNAAMMMRAGIVSSINSDSSNLIRYMNLEAAKSMRFGGLTADETLRLITINPAIQIGLADRIGSIETGKDGDLAVFTGHPLDVFSRCVLTLIEGEVFFHHPEFNPEAPVEGPGTAFVPSPPRGPLDIVSNPSGRYVIAGGTVHPVSGPAIENGVVVIAGGRIEYVGRNKPALGGSTVVNAEGLHVYPGLINAATNLGLYEIGSLNATRDSRDIARFQPDIAAVSALNPHSVHLDIARCEGITTVGVWPGGGTICGQGGLIQLSGWTMPEMLRVPKLGLVMNLPSLPNELDPDKKKSLLDGHLKKIAEIERYIEKARHYAAVREVMEKSPRLPAHKDVALEAMIPYVTGEKPVLFPAQSYKEILEAIHFAEVYELRFIIYGGREAWKCAEALADKDIPVILDAVLDGPPGPFERFDSAYACAGKLEAAGVRFCIATSDAALAKRLPLHAGMAAAHGLSREGAIKSITLAAAEILGAADTIGSLDIGKTADIIITTGNPCQPSTRTVASFINGTPVALTSLHERSYRTFSNRPTPELPPIGALAGPPPMLETEATR